MSYFSSNNYIRYPANRFSKLARTSTHWEARKYGMATRYPRTSISSRIPVNLDENGCPLEAQPFPQSTRLLRQLAPL